MSTHNIGLYEDLTKIIFELSSNIIKYAPYFFCWNDRVPNPFFKSLQAFFAVGLDSEKRIFSEKSVKRGEKRRKDREKRQN